MSASDYDKIQRGRGQDATHFAVKESTLEILFVKKSRYTECTWDWKFAHTFCEAFFLLCMYNDVRSCQKYSIR